MRTLVGVLCVTLISSLAACAADTSADSAGNSGAEAVSKNSVPQIPTGRTTPAGALGPDGRIYVIGGHFHPGNDQAFTTVEAYNPVSNTWTTETPLPTSRNLAAAVAGPDGLLYVIGGNDGVTNSLLKSVLAYDPRAQTWTEKADMPMSRGSHAAALGADGRIYVLGGFSDEAQLGTELDSVIAYDPKTDTWTTLQSMHNGRASGGAALGADGKIYAIGGTTTKSVEAYDPATNQWSDAPDSTIDRTGSCVVAVKGRIYSIGGAQLSTRDIGFLDNGELLGQGDSRWTPLKKSMPQKRAGAACAADGAGKIYVFGGGEPNKTDNGGPVLIRSVDVFDTAKGEWTKGK
jgi:N-acetylneuraminic acid mutarotase